MKCERCYEFDCVCDGRDPFNVAEIAQYVVRARDAVTSIRQRFGQPVGSRHQSSVSMHHLPWEKRWEVHDALVKAGLSAEIDASHDYATLRTSVDHEPEFLFFIDVPKHLRGDELKVAVKERHGVELELP